MKVLIIGGFLGSGKTSAILQLARYIVRTAVTDSDYKVAILENEIGEVGVDDKVLKAGGYQVENLFAGCACCTMSGEVPFAVDRIQKDLSPEWLILEATGVAYPLSIKETLEGALGLECRICAVVDVGRWHKMLRPLGSLLGTQLSDADTILINKIDLADHETLESVKESVSSFNPTATLLSISAAADIDDAVWEDVLGWTALEDSKNE
jgi:Putative GTPases (G3E family)